MTPFVTRKTQFGWHVSKLVFGVNIFDLDLWLQVSSVEQPIKRNSVGSRHMPHCWTSSFDNHLDDSFFFFGRSTCYKGCQKSSEQHGHVRGAEVRSAGLHLTLNTPTCPLSQKKKQYKGQCQSKEVS